MSTASRLVEPVPDWALCKACHAVALDPYTACSAQHVLCGPCVAALPSLVPFAPQEDPSCPVCQETVKPKPFEFLRRIVDEFVLVCERKELGCAWEGKVGEEKEHDQQCLYRTLRCPLCPATYPATYPARESNSHVRVCPNVVIVCSRGGIDCGGIEENGKYPRCESEAHAERCTEFAYVPSAFPSSHPFPAYALLIPSGSCRVACSTRTTRRNLETHERHCINQQEQLVVHKNRVHILEAEVERLKKAQRAGLPVKPGENVTAGQWSTTQPSPPASLSPKPVALSQQQQQQQQQQSPPSPLKAASNLFLPSRTPPLSKNFRQDKRQRTQ
ncbi:hypothetical protein JCM8097_000186 [Rhodosporidiobolus ruineniae]